MKFKTIDLQHLGMLEAQATMLLMQQEHKHSSDKTILSFILPRDKRGNFNKILSKQPLYEEISEATDRNN